MAWIAGAVKAVRSEGEDVKAGRIAPALCYTPVSFGQGGDGSVPAEVVAGPATRDMPLHPLLTHST